MPSSTSPDEADSRTSSVGRRKRVFDQSTAAEDAVLSLENDISNDEDQPDEKRQRLAQEIDIKDARLQDAPALSPNILVIDNSLESGRSPQRADAIHFSEDCQVDVANVIGTPLTWNTGVPVTIRTSFTERKAQSSLISTRRGQKPQEHITNTQVDAIAASVNRAKNSPMEIYSETDKAEPHLALIESVEKVVGITQGSESKLQSPWLVNIGKQGERKQGKDLERDGIEKSRSMEREATTEEEELTRMSKIIDRLPSSFGSRLAEEEAEEIIRGLPEADKDLMPRVAADTAFKFYDMGRTFKLPQRISENLPVVQLSKISFCDPKHSFVVAFLAENRSLLEFINFKLLVRAFQEYLRLIYGHLPDRLLSMVCSNKYVTGPKRKKRCIRLLAKAKKQLPQETESDEFNTQNAELEEAEGLSDDIESISNLSDSEKHKVLLHSESGNGLLGSSKTLSFTLDTQSHNLAEDLKNSDTSSTGRLLEFKSTLSQGVRSAAVDNSYSTARELPDERGSMHPQEFNSESAQGSVPASDQLGYIQKLADSHLAELGLFHRYHPSAERQSILQYCLTCAHTDHGSSNCPSFSCAICGLRGEHFSSGCPKKQRCTRCHELGHRTSECLEKLAATAHGTLSCDICASSHHLESFCHFIWRSFSPDKLELPKLVAEIPIHCYTCGAEGHFGSECGIRQSTLFTDGYSWSVGNWRRFVDPQSQNRALSAGKDFRIPSMKGTKSFGIRDNTQQRGKASEDDDESIPFIRDKVIKPSRPIPRGTQQIKLEQNHQENEYYRNDRFEPPFTDLRYQTSRPMRPVPPQKTSGKDSHEFSYSWRDDSARHMRERSFSPPPRFYQEQHLSRSGENSNTKKEKSGYPRTHGRGGTRGRSNIPSPAPNARGNPKQGPPKRGTAQSGRGGAGAGAPRGKRQRNRKG